MVWRQLCVYMLYGQNKKWGFLHQLTITNIKKLTESDWSGAACLFLREENLCWLLTENLRKDSRLREAKCRKDDVRLKGFLLPPSTLVVSCVTAVVTKLRASCRDLLMVPIHWFMCVCATVNLSPRYSIIQAVSKEYNILSQNTKTKEKKGLSAYRPCFHPGGKSYQ